MFIAVHMLNQEAKWCDEMKNSHTYKPKLIYILPAMSAD